MKHRNPAFGSVRIAQQISYAFGLDIDKDVVRRVLAKHYRPGDCGTNGPSWLTFIGHAKDSLEIEEIKSVPYVPVSHPFIEWLIGTVRREYLDRVFFWNALDLVRKLDAFQAYYNAHRVHRSLDGITPAQRAGASCPIPAAIQRYAWRQPCRGLFHTPMVV